MTKKKDEQAAAPVGVRCPYCNCGHSRTVDSRQRRGGQRRRIRLCMSAACGRQFFTRETVVGTSDEKNNYR